VDSHELWLCAPPPVLIGAGRPIATGDDGRTPRACFWPRLRRPGYKLLGKKDLGTTEFPAREIRSYRRRRRPTVSMAAATPTYRTADVLTFARPLHEGSARAQPAPVADCVPRWGML